MGKKSVREEAVKLASFPFLQQIAFDVGKKFSVRPKEVYDEWEYNEVMSYWIVIKEEEYQSNLAQVDKKEKGKFPKRLFILEEDNKEEKKEVNIEEHLAAMEEFEKTIKLF